MDRKPTDVTAAVSSAAEGALSAAAALRRQIAGRLGGTVPDEDAARTVRRATTVLRPAEEVRAFWADPARLPELFDAVQRVDVVGEGRTHWVAEGPFGATVEWDAELVADEPGRLVWDTTGGRGVAHLGEVTFAPAPGDRGTELRVTMRYQPVAGAAGTAVAKATGTSPEQQLREALGRLKSLLETGEVIRVDGQPTGRSEGAERRTQVVDDLLRRVGRS